MNTKILILLLLSLLFLLLRGDRLQRSWRLLRRLRIHENVVHGQKAALAGRPGLPGRLDVGGGACLGRSKWEISLVLVANSCSAKKPEQDEEEGRQEERGPPASQPGPSGCWKGEKEFPPERGNSCPPRNRPYLPLPMHPTSKCRLTATPEVTHSCILALRD